MDQVILFDIMINVDDETLSNMSCVNKETNDIYNNMTFKIEKAKLDLKRVFNIISFNNTYTYEEENEYLYCPCSNAYEFFLYRKSLLTGRAKTIIVPYDIFSNENDDPLYSVIYKHFVNKSEKGIEIIKYIIENGAKRGDRIRFRYLDSHANEGTMFFDGNTIILTDQFVPELFPIIKDSDLCFGTM